MNDKELMQKIDDVCGCYKGDISYLYEAVGMIVVGRLYGWRVMRLAAGRRAWSDATKLFGDPKKLMREKERYAGKSVGLRIVESVGDYWQVINRQQSMPVHDKRIIE